MKVRQGFQRQQTRSARVESAAHERAEELLAWALIVAMIAFIIAGLVWMQ